MDLQLGIWAKIGIGIVVYLLIGLILTTKAAWESPGKPDAKEFLVGVVA